VAKSPGVPFLQRFDGFQSGCGAVLKNFLFSTPHEHADDSPNVIVDSTAAESLGVNELLSVEFEIFWLETIGENIVSVKFE